MYLKQMDEFSSFILIKSFLLAITRKSFYAISQETSCFRQKYRSTLLKLTHSMYDDAQQDRLFRDEENAKAEKQATISLKIVSES